MNPGDRALVTGIVLVLAVLWGGFLVHRSPDFAGSTAGGFFGVAGAVLMVLAALMLIEAIRILLTLGSPPATGQPETTPVLPAGAAAS